MTGLFLFFVVSLMAFADSSPDAAAIVRNAVDKLEGESVSSEISLQIIRPNWEHELQMRSWSKGYDYGMVLVTAPARERGQAYLKRGDELWNWLPNINRTVKLSASLMSQQWMGSDFTNEDVLLGSSFLVDYKHRFLAFEELRGFECYKLELIPLERAPVVWGMVHLWVSVNTYDQIRAKFYDDRGVLVRTMDAYEIKQFGDVEIPSRIEMRPEANPMKKTIMRINEYELNIQIDKDFFSIQNMQRIR